MKFKMKNYKSKNEVIIWVRNMILADGQLRITYDALTVEQS